MGACAKQEEIIFFVVCPFQRDFVDRDLPFIMMLSEIEQEGAGGRGKRNPNSLHHTVFSGQPGRGGRWHKWVPAWPAPNWGSPAPILQSW